MADDLQAALAPETPATPSQPTTPATAEQVQSSPSEPAPKLSFRDALSSNLEKAEAKISRPQEGPGQTPQAAPEIKAAPVANQTQVAPTQHAPILPPSDMNAEEKAAFQSGDPIGLQKYYARRAYEMRADYKRQTMELEARRKSVEAFEKVVDRHKDHYILQGQDPAQVFERALAWDRRIKEEPISGALEYLKAYGISPQDLIKAAQGQPQQPQQAQQQSYGPEDIQQMIEERLQARIQEAEKQATMQKLSSAVDKFIASKPVLADPGTQDAVTRAMAPYAQAAFASDPSADPEKVLESVYKFVLAEQFPDLHSRLQARSIADAKNSEASKAKQAGKSISGSLSSGEPKRKFKNFREALEAHMR